MTLNEAEARRQAAERRAKGTTLVEERPELRRKTKRKPREEGLVSVAPRFAELNPEAVTEIDGKFFRPALSASESRAFAARGLTKPQAYAEKLNPPAPLAERDIPDLPEHLWGPGSEGLPKGERARLRQEWLGQQGFTFKERAAALREQELSGKTELGRLTSEAAGGLPSAKAQEPPASFRGDVARWEQFVLESVGGDPKVFEAWKQSGLSLPDFMGGARFGEGIEQIGLQPHIGYNLEKLKPWFDRLRSYRQFNFQNQDIFRTLGENTIASDATIRIRQSWVRGAQLGLSPEAYISLAQGVADKFQAVSETFPQRGAGGEVFGEFEAGVTPPKEEVLAEISDVEKYLLGLSDVAPEGFKSIPIGEMISQAPGRLAEGFPGRGRQTADEWFEDTFPSIAGDRGGARPSPGGFGDIFTGSGRFARRVKTIKF